MCGVRVRCVVRGEPWLVVIGEGTKGRTQRQAKLVLRWKSLGTGRGRRGTVGFQMPRAEMPRLGLSCSQPNDPLNSMSPANEDTRGAAGD